jgi:hypothetical protein
LTKTSEASVSAKNPPGRNSDVTKSTSPEEKERRELLSMNKISPAFDQSIENFLI